VTDKTKPLLMTVGNPTGFTIEELTHKLCLEMLDKYKQIESNQTLVAVGVKANNQEIVKLLERIEELSKDTANLLDGLDADDDVTTRRLDN